MKYGQTLHRRSIPEWGPYNVDYNDIKHLIKARTTKGQATAISIPGHGDENAALEEFEEQLYVEFEDQHQRINLFVKSKAGEIQRRLTHLDKQIARLVRHKAIAEHSRPSVRLMEKFSKIEEDVLKAGEELQSLSRFLGANRTAFRKLLKKYRKWTGSSTLSQRFQSEVLDQPSNFSQDNFGPLLAHFTETLAAVRAPFEPGKSPDRPPWKRSLKLNDSQARRSNQKHLATNRKNSASGSAQGTLSSSQQDGLGDQALDIEFDTAFATLSGSTSGGKATYWIHPDNLVELQVLLLQHTRLRICRSRASSLGQNDGYQRLQNGSTKVTPRHRVQDETGRAIFDDLERLAEVQSSATVGDVESTPGNMAERATMSVYWCSSGDATVVLKDSVKGKKNPRTLKVKKKNLPALFDLDQPLDTLSRPSQLSTVARSEEQDESINFAAFRGWLTLHDTIKPLVQISNSRLRYSGLQNTHDRGTWITLDQDVSMKRAQYEFLGNDSETPEEADSKASLNFPHAVLTVRWEGSNGADLVRLLDKSHLTERVRGFSVEAHAVYVLCQPKQLSPPIWLPALEKDILKVPAPKNSENSRDTFSTPGTSSTKAPSPSAGSTTEPSSGAFIRIGESSATSAPDLLERPPLSAFKKKRKHQGYTPSLHPAEPLSREQRYWNEFDDGSEAGDEPFTIFVDPNATVDFPGKELIQQMREAVSLNVLGMTRKVRAWIVPSESSQSEERRSLLEREPASPSTDDSDIENCSTEEQATYSRRLYSTFLSQHEHRNALHRETFIFDTCLGCFAAAIILLVVGTILAATGRHRAHAQVEIGVIVAVVSSLTFSIVGVGMMLVRREPLGWPHRIIVLTTFATICVVSGVLLAMMATR